MSRSTNEWDEQCGNPNVRNNLDDSVVSGNVVPRCLFLLVHLFHGTAVRKEMALLFVIVYFLALRALGLGLELSVEVVPKRRTEEPKYMKRVLAFGMLAVGLYYVRHWWILLDLISWYLTGHFLQRICYLRPELVDQQPVRYRNNKKQAWERVMGTLPEAAGYIASFAYLIVAPFVATRPSAYWSMIWTTLAVRILMSDSFFEKNPLIVFQTIGNKHSGLFYGISMAYSFYHGYLNIILPNKGNPDEAHFQDRLDEYIESNVSSEDRRISVPDRRLYILVPASGEVPTSIKDNASSGWIEDCKNKSSVRRDRGGVKLRTYHNTVYRIKDPQDHTRRPVYFVGEYASPLTTYNEACTHFSSDASWRTYKRDTVISFYETCLDVVGSDPRCNRNVHFIYFEDKDENGQFIDVTNIILENIRAEADRQGIEM